MSNSGNPGAASLFTIAGSVKVHLLDGQVLEGNIVAQDAFNIFVSVAGSPTMIPRTQIRYLQGQPGQTVVADSDVTPVEPQAAPAIPAETTAKENLEEVAEIVPPVVTEEVLPPVATEEVVAPVVAEEVVPSIVTEEVVPPILAEEVLPPVIAEEPPIVRERQKTDESINAVFTAPLAEPMFEPIAAPVGNLFLDSDEGTVVLGPEALSLPEGTKEEPKPEVNEEEGTLVFDLDAGLEDDQTFVLATKEDPESTDIFTPGPRLDESDTTVVVPLTGREAEVTATLFVTSGPHNGDEFTLRSGITTMGRSSDNVIVLSKDKEISRHHAIIIHESGQYVIQDQNSLNGTFVNEEQISGPYYLKDGDKILVGLSTLKYSLG